MRLFFDTCVYFNQTISFGRIEKKLSLTNALQTDYQLTKLLAANKFEQIISDWSLLELEEQLKKFWWERKTIQMGLHPQRDYWVAKKTIFLEPIEVNEIDTIIEGLKKESTNGTTPVDLKEIFKLQKKGVEFIDAILFIQANAAGSDYFITRDEIMLEKINKIGYRTTVKHPEEIAKEL